MKLSRLIGCAQAMMKQHGDIEINATYDSWLPLYDYDDGEGPIIYDEQNNELLLIVD